MLATNCYNFEVLGSPYNLLNIDPPTIKKPQSKLFSKNTNPPPFISLLLFGANEYTSSYKNKTEL